MKNIRIVFALIVLVMVGFLTQVAYAATPTAETIDALDITAGSAVLVGMATKNGGYAIDSWGFNYGIEGDTTGGYQTERRYGHINSNEAQTVSVSRLKPATLYWYQFFAVNEDGESQGSYYYFVTLNGPSKEIIGNSNLQCVLYARTLVPSLPTGLTTYSSKIAIINDYYPEVGSVAIIKSSAPEGHVAVVVEYDENYVTVQESNWDVGRITVRTNTPDGLKIMGYYNPNK